jgi:peptidoglycan/LPS O-acetylase OafA/YrhL
MMMMIIGNFVVSVLDFVFVERPNYPTNNSFLFIFIKTIVRLNASAYFSFFLLGYVANFFGNQTSIRISNKYCGLGPKLISLFLISLVMVPNYHGNSISALGVIFISVLVNYFLSPSHWYGTIFSSIGKYSYSMYYIHILYFLLIKKFVKFQKLTLSNPIFQPSMFMLFFLSAITISFFLASLSYKVIERPILNLARKNSSF